MSKELDKINEQVAAKLPWDVINEQADLRAQRHGYLTWENRRCDYCRMWAPEGIAAYKFYCHTCQRAGCPDCMPAGDDCDCPECVDNP